MFRGKEQAIADQTGVTQSPTESDFNSWMADSSAWFADMQTYAGTLLTDNFPELNLAGLANRQNTQLLDTIADGVLAERDARQTQYGDRIGGRYEVTIGILTEAHYGVDGPYQNIDDYPPFDIVVDGVARTVSLQSYETQQDRVDYNSLFGVTFYSDAPITKISWPAETLSVFDYHMGLYVKVGDSEEFTLLETSDDDIKAGSVTVNLSDAAWDSALMPDRLFDLDYGAAPTLQAGIVIDDPQSGTSGDTGSTFFQEELDASTVEEATVLLDALDWRSIVGNLVPVYLASGSQSGFEDWLNTDIDLLSELADYEEDDNDVLGWKILRENNIRDFGQYIAGLAIAAYILNRTAIDDALALTMTADDKVGDIDFNGVAGGNVLTNDFAFGDINFRGAAGYNEMTNTGKIGDINFYGVAGGNVITNETIVGDVDFYGGGLYNEVSRVGPDGINSYGDLSFYGLGAINVIRLEVTEGDLDVYAAAYGQVISRTGAGSSIVNLVAYGNLYSDDGQSDLQIIMGGYSNNVFRDDGGAGYTGYTDVYAVGGSNIVSVSNDGDANYYMLGGVNSITHQGTGNVDAYVFGGANVVDIADAASVDAGLYGLVNIFSYSGSGDVSVDAVGGYNNVDLSGSTGSSEINSYGIANLIEGSQGRDEINAYGAYTRVDGNGSIAGEADQISVYGMYSEVVYGSTTGTRDGADNSLPDVVEPVVSDQPVDSTVDSEANFSALLDDQGIDKADRSGIDEADGWLQQYIGLSPGTFDALNPFLAAPGDATYSGDAYQAPDEDTLQQLEDQGQDTTKLREAPPDESSYEAPTDAYADDSAYVQRDADGNVVYQEDEDGNASASFNSYDYEDKLDTSHVDELQDRTYGPDSEGAGSDAGGEAAQTVGPIVIDMNGNGSADLVSADPGAPVFDTDGDGNDDSVSWLDSSSADMDGFLWIDANADGKIQSSEMIFADGTDETDAEALHDIYGDTFDENDSDYQNAYVWRDYDGDGEKDDGEAQKLSDLGIDSIDLDVTTDQNEFGVGDSTIYRTLSAETDTDPLAVFDVGLMKVPETGDYGVTYAGAGVGFGIEDGGSYDRTILSLWTRKLDRHAGRSHRRCGGR